MNLLSTLPTELRVEIRQYLCYQQCGGEPRQHKARGWAWTREPHAYTTCCYVFHPARTVLRQRRNFPFGKYEVDVRSYHKRMRRCQVLNPRPFYRGYYRALGMKKRRRVRLTEDRERCEVPLGDDYFVPELFTS